VLRRRREFSIFTLSFLDIMSCGFGAVVLLFMISKHATTQQVETATYDYGSEVSQLQNEIAQSSAHLSELRERLTARGGELESARSAAALARDALAAQQAQRNPARGGGAREIEALRAAVLKLETDKRMHMSQPHDKSRYLRSVVGEGNREYLTGVQLGGKRILLLLDTSASMLEEKMVNVLITRNREVEKKRQAGKWQRALKTLDWIAAHFPQQASFQIVGFDSDVHFALPGTEKQWLPVKDITRLDAAIDAMKAAVPNGGNSLERAFMLIAQMNPKPDNVYLITDGLPTQGLEQRTQGKVDGRERLRLFERARDRLPRGIPVNTILLPLDGDPAAAAAYWQLARYTQGSFLSPSRDWP
jgi:hypothetical protein